MSRERKSYWLMPSAGAGEGAETFLGILSQECKGGDAKREDQDMSGPQQVRKANEHRDNEYVR